MAQWIDCEVFCNDKETPIEDWQSAKCSNCGRFLTTPYTYAFTHYKYCPSCGSKMDEESTIADKIRAMSDEELASYLIDVAYDNMAIDRSTGNLREGTIDIPSPLGGYLAMDIEFGHDDVLIQALQEEYEEEE